MDKVIKLRHWDLFLSEPLDMKVIMEEVDGFVVPRRKKGEKFVESYSRMTNLIDDLSKVDVKKLEFQEGCEIQPPKYIDGITFVATMELQQLRGDSSQYSFANYIANHIAICCYGEVYDGDFDRDSKNFKDFVKSILDKDGFSMIGLYNHLEGLISANVEFWDKAFFQVSHTDSDYIAAGGARMNAFNVIETLKGVCQDFNFNLKEAWQQPYSLVQANSLAKATSADIERNLSEIKEQKFKARKR